MATAEEAADAVELTIVETEVVTLGSTLVKAEEATRVVVATTAEDTAVGAAIAIPTER